MNRGIFAAVLFAAVAAPAVALADEIHVPGDFRRLQPALDAAQPGDVIVLDAKVLRGQFEVTTPGIVIEGRGTRIVGPTASRRRLTAGLEIFADGVTVRGIDFVRAGVVGTGSDLVVEDCTFARCDVIHADPYAVMIEGARARIEGNRVLAGRRGNLRGVWLRGEDGMIRGNRIEGNRNDAGIVVTGPRTLVEANVIEGPNATDGINVTGEDAVVTGNRVRMPEGQRYGVIVSGQGALVEGNTVDVTDSLGPSVFVRGTDGTIADNDVTAGSGTAIIVHGDGWDILGNRVQGVAPLENPLWRTTFGHGIVARGGHNAIRGNRLFETPGDGIRVVGGEGNVVDGCRVEGSDACGVLNAAPGTDVTGSTFTSNGIDIVNGGTFTNFTGNDFSTGSPDAVEFPGSIGELEDWGVGVEERGFD